MNQTVLELGIIVVLVLFNGVFSATEIALVTVRRSRLQQLIDEGSASAARVLRQKQAPGRFLAVIQIGINFLGFLASAFAAVSLVTGFETWLVQFGALQNVAGHPRPDRGDQPPDDLHDHLRRAGPQADRPCPRGAGGHVDQPVHRRPRGRLRPARRLPDLDHPAHQPAVRRRRGRGRARSAPRNCGSSSSRVASRGSSRPRRSR